MTTENVSSLSNKEEENDNNNNDSEIQNIFDELDENCDLEKLKNINIKSVDLIFEEKPEKSLEYLKKLEAFLENKIIDIKTNINKKFIIIVLHNIACCYQKLKDNDNCINYLEAVIYHFDKIIENKHKITINEEYFDSLIKSKNYNYDKKLLGDLILELRFCAKFHLQMGVVLSEAKRHVDSLKHIKLAALICEDNLIKTTYLYNELKEILLNNSNNNNNRNNENKNDELESIKQQIKNNHKIISELNKRILKLRNNNIMHKIQNNKNIYEPKNSKKNMKSIYNNNYMYIKNVITKIVENSSTTKKKSSLPSNNYNSYINYRNNEINNYMENNSSLNNIKTIFENNFNQKDDWIKLLNIENIMYLSALNYEDLDLESDPKYELLRDSILEKVIMLTVSYFCLSNELKYLSKDKNNKNINGEYYLYNAINLSIIFLPVSCSIIRYYINTYYKNYGQGMDIIPEGEIIDCKIDIIKKEIDILKDEENNTNNKNNEKINDKLNIKDFIYFIKTQKINRIIKEENNYFNINSDLNRNKSKLNNNIFNLNDYSENYYTLKKNKINDNNSLEEKNISNEQLIHSAHSKLNNYKELQIINISDNNLLNKKNILSKISNEINNSNTSKISNSPSSSNASDYENKNDNYTNITNGNFGLIPNNNYFERMNKSKISENKAPKFKLNFNNININNDFNDSHSINIKSGSVTSHINTKIGNRLNSNNKIKEKNKMINSDKKKQIYKAKIKNKDSNKIPINYQFNNNNCKTNTNINLNNVDKNNNNKYIIKNFNKINIQNLGYKTDRLHLKGINMISNTQRKIICKKNTKSKNTKKYIKIKKINNSINEGKPNNANNLLNISKYFNIKGSNFTEKECLTDRFIVKINNKLKNKTIKMKKNITHNSNSPFARRQMNNQIYNNYIKKKNKGKTPIKLIQNSKNASNKDEKRNYSDLSDNQKNNISNGSNVRIFYSNDSNNEENSSSKKIYKMKGQVQQINKININKYKNKNDNKYLKNINLIVKIINNSNNKNNSLSEKTFNKEINLNNQTKFHNVLKKMNILPQNKGKIYTSNLKNPKLNNLQIK